MPDVENERDPLLKEVPTQLFHFEEKIFGMALHQLLSDLGAGLGLLLLTASLPPVLRWLSWVVLLLPILWLIHGKVHGQPVGRWLLLVVRYQFLPKRTTWQSITPPAANRSTRTPPSVQRTWIPFDEAAQGMMGYSEPGGRGGARGRYWAILEVEGRNVRYLPKVDQVRLFGRFDAFLAGLLFRLQFLTLTEQIDPATHPALRRQHERLTALRETSPCLAELQQASITYQQRHLHACTTTRNFVVAEISAREGAEDGRPGLIPQVLRRLFSRSAEPITREQLIQHLHIRVSVLRKAYQQLDIRTSMLDEPNLLKSFASFLVPGTALPSFEAEAVDPRTLATASTPLVTTKDEQPFPAQNALQRVRGLHGTFISPARKPGTPKSGGMPFADLVAPSRVELFPDAVAITLHGKTRYLRYFTIGGYPPHLPCGWLDELSELGLPLITSTVIDPLETPFVIRQLELQQIKLESKRFSDQKGQRIFRSAYDEEGNQLRRVLAGLVGNRLKMHAASLTIGIHASSRQHLDERSRYLLSHLRQQRLRVQVATRQHDRRWQSCLPICPSSRLEDTVRLPSDTLSSFLQMSNGIVGTPTGAFVGFTGSGFSRRPLYFDNWSTARKIPNPHVVILGETGMGKSWLGKMLVEGLIALGIADVVVLDRDDDYLEWHRSAPDETQRINLARGCPINFFALPFAPADVDPDDPADLLAEFLDNSLLVGLALLVCDVGSPLTKGEEAFLMHVARVMYAAFGITSETIRHHPDILLGAMPTLSDFLTQMQQTSASSEPMRASLFERLEKAAYLFNGQTSVSLEKPLTIFSIKDLDEKWYPLMTFVVSTFLRRHRALRRDDRFLAYVVEEASYLLKHPEGRRYLESGSRGFRKLGIAQFTLSQHPQEFLNEGQVVLSNAGTAFFLGMQREAAEQLHLPTELERVVVNALPGQAVMRCGTEYAAISIADIPAFRSLFTTDPQERRAMRERSRRAATAYATGGKHGDSTG